MISLKILKAVLKTATVENKDLVLKELISHIGNNYDYNNKRAEHIIEMLIDEEVVVTKDKINLEWIEQHPESLRYSHDKYNFRNFKVDSVDNIDCVVRVKYEYIEKINEDRDAVSYTDTYSNVSFLDYPEILK